MWVLEVSIIMKHLCKNHPERFASKRCYQCKDYICAECSSLIFRHYFCSLRCKTVYVLKTVSGRLKLKANIKRIIQSGVKPRDFHSLRAVFTPGRILIITFLIINIILLNTFNNRITELTGQLKAIQSKLATMEERRDLQPVEQEEVSFFPPALDSVYTSVIVENSITISGYGASNYILALYFNDVLHSAQASREGTFQFKDVRLLPGMNEISLKAVAPDNTVFHFGKMSVDYRSPVIDALSVNVRRGNARFPAVALTFDGGANSNNAAQILDILREKNVRSTIFLTGIFIEKYPDIVRRLIAEGHEVGNHTYSHFHLTTFEQNFLHETLPEITYESFQHELTQTDSLFRSVTSADIKKFWRAPYGEHNLELRRWAAERGYQHISWTQGHDPGESMDTRDWVSDETSELYKSALEIRDILLNFGYNDPDGANGAIVLMHLGSNRTEDFLYQTLPEIIDGFREQGYKLCTISELLAEINKR